jgi:hypothetical protein
MLKASDFCLAGVNERKDVEWKWLRNWQGSSSEHEHKLHYKINFMSKQNEQHGYNLNLMVLQTIQGRKLAQIVYAQSFTSL